MDRWVGKVALVTGAGGGLGCAITTLLARKGVKVVGLDLNDQNIKELAHRWKCEGVPGELHALRADLRQEKEILEAFSWIDDTFGGTDILVNNAGLFYPTTLSEGDTEEWRAVLEVNVLAVSICTREFLISLKKRNCDQGHVIMISSVAAHTVQYDSAAMYYASKCARSGSLPKNGVPLKSRVLAQGGRGPTWRKPSRHQMTSRLKQKTWLRQWKRRCPPRQPPSPGV